MKKNNLTALIAVEKDRNALTIGLMSRMKLHGMATALLKVCPRKLPTHFKSTLSCICYLPRNGTTANAAIQRLIRGAEFRYKTCLEQID